MKSTLLSILFSATAVSAAAVPFGSYRFSGADWTMIMAANKVLTEGRGISFSRIDRRDDSPQLGGQLPARKAAKRVDMPPQSGIPGAKRVQFIYGPFKVRGPNDPERVPGSSFSMDKGGTGYNFKPDTDFPRDVTVLLATSDLMTKDFRKATLDDKIYNHHTAFMETAPQSEDIFKCENSSMVAKNPPPINIFAGATTEKVEYDFISKNKNIKTGFYIKKDAFLQVMLDLVNFGPTDMFYSANEIEYIEGFPEGYLKSKQTILNPDVCGGIDGYALHPPAGQTKFTVQSTGVLMNKSGWIIRQRGHLHDGGTDITLEINGKKVCKSDALYGGPGFTFKGDDGKSFETINTSTECSDPILVHKGDKVKITANFDLGLHPSRPMGAGASEGAQKGGHHGMKYISNLMDGGEAEQMALLFLYFAQIPE